MAQYTLIIEIPNAGNQQFRYNLNLTRQAEDFPQDYFKKQENRDKLRVLSLIHISEPTRP